MIDKENYLAIEARIAITYYLIRMLLVRGEDLTATTVKRVFHYAYYRMSRNGEDLLNYHKKVLSESKKEDA